jgi:hypothetical protein
MDLNALGQGIKLFDSALSLVKQAIDLLPDGPNKEESLAALQHAEQEFKHAEAEVAKKLDYKICHNHWPPEIMLSRDRIHWECPKGDYKEKEIYGGNIPTRRAASL